MTALPIRRRDFATAQFAGWLARMGAEVCVPTNPYEVIRYRAYHDGSRTAQTHIVYAKEDGRLTFTGGSREHYADFLAGRDLAKPRQPASLKPPKLVPSKGDRKREKLLERDGNGCWFCGLPMGNDCTLEHLVPKSKGGRDMLANYALAHARCNRDAADLPLVQKIELRTKLRAASVDTHAKRGDAAETAAPSPMSGAVPAEERADAQPPSGDS